jgi:hypothetical protein
MTRLTKALFALLRLSVWEGRPDDLSAFARLWPVDWEQMFALSARHGTVLLAWGGITRLPPEYQPPRRLKLRWVANVVKGSERHVRRLEVVADLVTLLASGGIDTIVLKGLAMSKLYPVPYYREGGDIDIWTFGKSSEIDKLVSQRGIATQHPRPKHSTFLFEGAMVENHRTFFDTDLRFRRESALYRKMEGMLGALLTIGDSPGMGVGQAMELPPQAAALFLVGHTFRHFCDEGLNARQLCDWVVFFRHHEGELDHELLVGQLRELGIEDFAASINSFCAAWLGFRPAFLADTGDPRSEKLILGMIARYRRRPRIHTPVVGSLCHLLLRNRIYNRYLGKTSFREFLLPELKFYFVWLAGRLKPRRAARTPK